MKTIIQLLVVIVLAFVIFKWWQKNHQAAPPTAGASASQECAAAAAAAGETWGSGVGRFANPPYDTTAWADFRSRVETQARQAQEKCLCGDAACNIATGAMSDLRSLVNEMDSALRSGSPPPSDLVQRQDAIDNAINAARDQAK
ncbi:MAG: hypothetical protein M3041_17045 [Acidobacteriota bacterium]|nr:hypothetical protein [Acidobacteriota bacterium]